MNNRLDPDSSLIYISLNLLCSRQNSLIPELLYLLKPQQIVDFIKIFSGETLKVPTIEDFNRDLMTSLAIYHILVEDKSWDWFQMNYSLDGRYVNSIKSRINSWIKDLTSSEKSFIDNL